MTTIRLHPTHLFELRPASASRRSLSLLLLIGVLIHLANAARILLTEGGVIVAAITMGHLFGMFFLMAVILAVMSGRWCWESFADGPPHQTGNLLVVALAVADGLILAAAIIWSEPTLARDLARFDPFAMFFAAGTVNALACLALLLASRARIRRADSA